MNFRFLMLILNKSGKHMTILKYLREQTYNVHVFKTISVDTMITCWFQPSHNLVTVRERLACSKFIQDCKELAAMVEALGDCT